MLISGRDLLELGAVEETSISCYASDHVEFVEYVKGNSQ